MFLRSFCSSFNHHILVSFAVFCFAHTFCNSCTRQDRDSLASFHNRISAASPLNWSVSEDCCSWEGVDCDDSGRVTSLWLPSRGLSGGIPPSLSNLSSLSYLNLSKNWLSGPLPDGFFSGFNSLQVVDLSSNRITGELSTSDKLSATIQELNLSRNYLNGMFPSLFLQTALNLASLDVSNNGFSGLIPTSICSSASSIQRVDFSNNEFSGAIPTGFGRCWKLQSLRAGFNDISGEMTEDIYWLLELQELHLPGNRLTGQMNERMSNLVNLEILELQENSLTGKIPEDIGKLSKLETLRLHRNQLSGAIPASLANCTRLVSLCLRANFLEGKLSDLDFSKLVQLRTVDLGSNLFTGGLPGSLFSCKTLTAVRLAYNNLEGEILTEIVELQSLSFLSLSRSGLINIRNTLTVLSRCKNLHTLMLSRNFYDEEIPGSESVISSEGFQNLHTLSLRNSRLTGSIPLWLSKLTNLAVLELGGNCITGSIPGWLGTLPNLFFIELVGNRLSGHFPIELTRLPMLTSQAKPKQAEGNYFDFPVYYNSSVASDMQYNGLSSIPRSLFLSKNSISGSIPEEIGNMKFLAILKLDHNSFSGSIPSTISNLTNLERLDLSGNNLSGEIPASLRNLHFLSYFNVADNNLLGPIPIGGQFDTFPSSSFEGNPELCGQVIQQPCQAHPAHGQEPREGAKSAKELINWLSFEISYAVSFILTLIAILKVSYE